MMYQWQSQTKESEGVKVKNFPTVGGELKDIPRLSIPYFSYDFGHILEYGVYFYGIYPLLPSPGFTSGPEPKGC